jgi:hypothetical protein
MADAGKPEVARPADDAACPLGLGSAWAGITSFRTTDLCLFSAEDLTALAEALEAQGLDVRQRGLWVDTTEYFRIAGPQWYWRFQAGGAGPFDEPEPQITAMLAAVEALDPPARAAWAGCSQRVFDVAYDCGTRPFAVRNELSAGTLTRLAAAGGLLRITLYALDPSEIRSADPGGIPGPAGDVGSGSS